MTHSTTSDLSGPTSVTSDGSEMDVTLNMKPERIQIRPGGGPRSDGWNETVDIARFERTYRFKGERASFDFAARLGQHVAAADRRATFDLRFADGRMIVLGDLTLGADRRHFVEAIESLYQALAN